MATRTKSTKSTAKATEVETPEVVAAEPTVKSQINDGITAVVEATGVDSQKARYKAMRAIAFVAFRDAIEAGTFDDLVQAAIADADQLPAGWQLERPVKAEVKAPAKKVAAKAPAKAPAKAAAKTPAKASAARRRPTR